ncbi:MAG: hypothetical protein VB013_04045 [Anaerolineaceae bacterium]|nr:hypothetical protein [Anaerolineaceae bacterium]
MEIIFGLGRGSASLSPYVIPLHYCSLHILYADVEAQYIVPLPVDCVMLLMQKMIFGTGGVAIYPGN